MANQRKAGKKKLQVWMEDEERKQLEELAKVHGYSTVTGFLQAVANGVVKTSTKILIGCCLIAKLIQGPTDWSGDAIAASLGTGLSWFATGAGYVLGFAWQAGGAILAAL